MDLGRRERQIMDAVYRRGRASVAEVRAGLPDPPTYSAVRGMLRFLEDKGLLRHEQDGVRYVYIPTVAPAKARRSALRHLVRPFSAVRRNRPWLRCSRTRGCPLKSRNAPRV